MILGTRATCIYIYIYIYTYMINQSGGLPCSRRLLHGGCGSLNHVFSPSGTEIDVRNGFGGLFCSGLHVSDVQDLPQEAKTSYIEACLGHSVRQKFQNMIFLVDLLKSVNWLHFSQTQKDAQRKTVYRNGQMLS